MLIAPLPRSIRDYITSFDLIAIALYRHGRVGSTKDPAGAAMAWWVESDRDVAALACEPHDGARPPWLEPQAAAPGTSR